MYAYILVGLRDCDEQAVLEEFVDYSEVEDAHILFGEWDLIVKLKTASAEDVATFVMEKVRKHDDVKLTSTLIVAK